VGEPIPVPDLTEHMPGGPDVRSKKRRHYVPELDLRCPGCGCQLEPYEVMAGRIRGLDPPVCIGCLAIAVVALRDHVLPLFDEILGRAVPGA